MENRQKIVKKITKPVIFTLCCVLILGVLSLPIFAVESDNNIYFRASSAVDYNNLGFELTYDNNGLPQLKAFPINQTIAVGANYKPYQFESTANSTYGFCLEFFTYRGCRIVVIDPSYPDTFVDTFDIVDSVTNIYIDLADYDFVPTISCVRTINTSSTGAFQRVYIQIDTEYSPSQDYQDGFNAGYNQGFTEGNYRGFDDGYEAGYADGLAEAGNGDSGGFLQLLFSPIQALNAVVLYDTNGSSAGGEVTIGGIFWTILGILLLTAFMRYFAGG